MKGLSINRAGLHKELGFLLIALLLFFVGCGTTGMTKYDKESQDAGMTLHCTEVAGESCLTHQWFNEVQTTYQRYHNGED